MADYEAHYSDASSTEYRRRFIYAPMFGGMNLSGMRVLDAMCGSGQSTDYLLAHDAIVSGLDILTKVVDSFKARWPTCKVERRSLLSSGFADNSLGNIAFLRVLNSLIFRIPVKVKPLYSPVLMSLESAISKLQGKLSSCFAIAQWRKQ